MNYTFIFFRTVTIDYADFKFYWRK